MSLLEPNQSVFDQASRGHRSMLLSQGLKIGCKILSVLLLARLVPPADHGLFAMASSVVLILALFRDAGLGAAAIRAPTLDESQLNTLFWAHLCLGAVLALFTASIAPLAAEFYTNPAVQPLLFTMSAAFLLIGAGGFARAQLERSVRFVDVSWIEGIAAIAGTVTMIAAGAAGAGAYSFAAYLLISEAVAAGLAWRALQWRPHAAPRWSSLRGLVRMGADVTSYQVIVHSSSRSMGLSLADSSELTPSVSITAPISCSRCRSFTSLRRSIRWRWPRSHGSERNRVSSSTMHVTRPRPLPILYCRFSPFVSCSRKKPSAWFSAHNGLTRHRFSVCWRSQRPLRPSPHWRMRSM